MIRNIMSGNGSDPNIGAMTMRSKESATIAITPKKKRINGNLSS
jgi:hypothetical protein